MDRLSALDATFLELEQADHGAHMHIGAVLVFEPHHGRRPPSLQEVRARLVERLDALPRYRQRLSSPTVGGLRFPVWEPDPESGVAAHVKRAALPAPGGLSELLDWAGDFYSHRLDRSRPLWRLVLLEGLEGGRWALCTKTHHCVADGVGSVDAGLLLLDGAETMATAWRPRAQPDGSLLSLRCAPREPALAHCGIRPRRSSERPRSPISLCATSSWPHRTRASTSPLGHIAGSRRSVCRSTTCAPSRPASAAPSTTSCSALCPVASARCCSRAARRRP